MKKKPNDLIRQLIDNKINREGMEIFLEGMDDVQTRKIYENYLENHFNEIMDAYQKNISGNKQEN